MNMFNDSRAGGGDVSSSSRHGFEMVGQDASEKFTARVTVSHRDVYLIMPKESEGRPRQELAEYARERQLRLASEADAKAWVEMLSNAVKGCDVTGARTVHSRDPVLQKMLKCMEKGFRIADGFVLVGVVKEDNKKRVVRLTCNYYAGMSVGNGQGQGDTLKDSRAIFVKDTER